MITAEIIKTMKQNNVSTDAELTKERVKAVLKTASREQKGDIDTLAGLKRVSINRVYSTGSISVKIAIAIAQVMGIDPFYLTGEADEQGEYSYDILSSFLAAKGYADLAKKDEKPKRKYTRRETAAKAPTQAALPAPNLKVYDGLIPGNDKAEEDMPDDVYHDTFPDLSEMTEEEMVQLIRALFVEAKYSRGAVQKIKNLKTVLIFE